MTVRDLAILPLPPSQPDRFASWPEDIKERCRQLWSTIAFGSGARTVRLLGRELGEGAALPTPSTINRWAIEDAWKARAAASLEESGGRTLYELQMGWLAALQLAQQTVIDGMTGEFDDLPFGGAGRLKAAEITIRTIERSGLLAILPAAPKSRDVNWENLDTKQKEALAREIMQERKASGRNW
jgi:hypothetical protein